MALANTFRGDTAQHARMAAWPDDLVARFEYLASDIGLFDSGSHAVDHRLRRNDLVRIMVMQYLEALASNVIVGRADPRSCRLVD